MLLPDIQGPSLSDSTATFSYDSRWPCSHQLLSLLSWEWVTHLFIHLFVHHSFITHILRTHHCQALKAQWQTRPHPLLDRLLVQYSGPYTCYAIVQWWRIVHSFVVLLMIVLGTLSSFSPSCDKSRRPVGESNIIQEKTFLFSKLQKIMLKVHYLQIYI